MDETSGKRLRRLFGASIELKCLFLFGAALALVILISAVLYYTVTKKYVEAQNPLMGKLLSEREFLLTHVKGLAVAPGADEREKTRSEVDELNDFIDSMAAISEKIGSIDEPTQAKFETRLIRFKNGALVSPSDARNEYEERLFADLTSPEGDNARNPAPNCAEYTDDEGRYHYYRPLVIARSCQNCHCDIMGDRTLELGSALGVIEVMAPEPLTKREIAKLWTIFLSGAIMTAIIGLVVFYAVIRIVVIRPLRSLQDV
ncbi:MAG: hypothetical protein HUK22_04095, partial [Thermoguttaceae bacterium]|nr:hypothetical protein [Thermoguttaceae bacterium]